MSNGRTMWFAQDVERHRRSLMVELQADFGGDTIAVDVALCAKAKLQNSGGAIRDGFAAVARDAGGPQMTRETARQIIEAMAGIGWLDDLTVDDDGRRFRCRVSGWASDQEKAHAAWRQAKRRAEQAEQTVTDRDELRHVAESHLTAQHSTEELPVEPARLDEARGRLQAEHVQAVFDEWVKATGRTGRTVLDDKRKRLIRNALKTYPLDDLLDAARGWRHSPHHRGENDRHTVFNDLGLLLRDGEHIEKFRDLERLSHPGETAQDRRDRHAAISAAQLGGDAA